MEVFKVFKVCFPVLLLLFCSADMSQQLRVEQRSVIKYLRPGDHAHPMLEETAGGLWSLSPRQDQSLCLAQAVPRG